MAEDAGCEPARVLTPTRFPIPVPEVQTGPSWSIHALAAVIAELVCRQTSMSAADAGEHVSCKKMEDAELERAIRRLIFPAAIHCRTPWMNWDNRMERVTGIEPASKAWEPYSAALVQSRDQRLTVIMVTPVGRC